MARQKTNLIIGLFVILGVVMGVVAIIWVGATSYFQKGVTYITYFDESVQGLQVDSSVKFRGVDVGRVESYPGGPRQPPHRRGHEDQHAGRPAKK